MRRSPVEVQQAHDSEERWCRWPLWYLSTKPRAFRSGGPRYRVPPATSTWNDDEVTRLLARAEEQPAALYEELPADGPLGGADPLVVHIHAALPGKAGCLALRLGQARSNEQLAGADRQVARLQVRGRHRAFPSAEGVWMQVVDRVAGRARRFGGGSRAVHDRHHLPCKDHLGFPALWCGLVASDKILDLLDGQEREPEQLTAHLPVVHLDEVLIELEWTRLRRVEPCTGAGGLAELGAVGRREEWPAHGMHAAAGAAANQIDAGQNVAPLVRATDLQLTALVLVQPPVVEGLQEHVGELGVRDPVLALDPGLDRLAGEHLVDRDVLADVPQEGQQRHVPGPVVVVDELPLPLGAEHPAHLLLDGGEVGAQRVLVEQVPLFAAASGIPPLPGGAAGERDGVVARQLEAPQHQQADEVAGVEAVGRRIHAVVQRDGTLVQAPRESISIGCVVDQPAGLEVGQQVNHEGQTLLRAARMNGVRRAVLAVACLLVAAGCSYTKTEVTPEIPANAQSSQIFAADGSLITTLQAPENRVEVALGRIPVHVQNAVISIEDERFYYHHGVD